MTLMDRVEKVDAAIIKWGDDNAHYLTTHIGLPRLIAQPCYAVVASSIVMIAMTYMNNGLITAILLGLFHIPIIIDMYMVTMRVAKDVGQEWTPQMAKRYRRYALVMRAASAPHRPALLLISPLLVSFILFSTTVLIFTGAEMMKVATNVVVMVNLVMFMVQMYARVIIPAEPREKRLRQLRPAFNTIG